MCQPSMLTSPARRRTVFLVADIHCASCISSIEEIVLGLHPRPVSVEVSNVTHSVSVEHDSALSTSTIAKALAEAGYPVEDFGPQSLLGRPFSHELHDVERAGLPLEALGRSVSHGKRDRKGSDEDARRRRHMVHCEQCRVDLALGSSQTNGQQLSPASVNVAEKASSPFVVVEPHPPTPPLSHARISITGMSCSSCVGRITEALEEKAWVRSVNIALLTQSATVEFEGDHDAEELVTTIDAVGYEATLEEVTTLSPAPATHRPSAVDLWKASVAIEGMTCSSCVGNVTNALTSLSWIKSAEVNLITNSATFVFEHQERLDETLQAIEDVGYGVKLDDISALEKDTTLDSRRTVSVRIEGMYCEHCPDRITEALGGLKQHIAVESAPTMKKPILTITYTPNAPDFTIRDILSAISATDGAFTSAIYHPPSLMERSKQMHARTRQRVLYRVLLAVIIAIPTFIIGIVFISLVPGTNAGRRYLMKELRGVTRAEWALLVMATPVYFFGADIFHRRTIKELHYLWRRNSPVPIFRRFYRFGSMDMLLSFGTTIAYVSSIAALIVKSTSGGLMDSTGNSTYFDSVVFLTMFLLLGRLIEAYSKAKTGEMVSKLGDLRPREAILIDSTAGKEENDRTSTVAVDLVETGDVVRVVHGASPPWDGILLDPEGLFDESSLTGESRPVKKEIGDTIYAGTLNNGKSVSMRTTGASGHSLLDQIIDAVQEGQARRAPIERVVDVLTSYFVPVVTLISVTTWLIWLSLGLSGTLPADYLDVEVGGWPFWSLQFAISVFVIACPCGIGLAAPTALFVGGGLAAKHGILVKGGGEAFQEASDLDVVVFDKTATLTQGGDPSITDHQLLMANDASNEQAVLGALVALEQNSSHPIAKAIVGFCQSRTASNLEPKDEEEIAGKGMKGSFSMVDPLHPMEMLVGNEALMSDYNIPVDSTTSDTLDAWKRQAKSIVLVAARFMPPTGPSSWTLQAIFAAADPLRPEAHDIVEAIMRQGVQVWMISGDNPTTASAVGAMVGIPAERIIGGVLPQQKADKIKYLQHSQVSTQRRRFFGGSQPARRNRAIVAMVGDGINDSPALAVADVGIAIGSGSDVAVSTASFVLVNTSLTTLLTLITLSRAVFQRVKFNFAWALVYNLAALPIAAGVLYPVKSQGQHIRLDPVWASLAMALSSVSVICSSLLLRSKLPIVGFSKQ
ncbi:hypothetical protein LTR56_026562 [Elasticomyces elasticus]|nr:hypothetical protein LTR56_026562 [Elasticomyces elasticus]